MSSLFNKALPKTTLPTIPQPTRLSLTTTTTILSMGLGLSLLVPKAYRDYRTFISYGPGGIPNNVFGWLIVTLVLNPFRREMLSTDIYDAKIKAGETTSLLSNNSIQPRKGERPVVGPHAVPQRQLTGIPELEVKEKLMQEFTTFATRNTHLVKLLPSRLELHTEAYFLADSVPGTNLASQVNREIAHVHGQGDFSVHVTLAPADCKKVIEAGWGQRHALSGSNVTRNLSLGRLPSLPEEYVLIYAPRDEEEVKVVMDIVAAGVKYLTGSRNVK